MSRTSAIICEFNPFHVGHKKLIDFARENGSDFIVCIMSGNFVQRGEPAIADKYTRARTALLSGADLVLELPMPFSSASAEYFAKAGVEIADKLGFVDELIFGSELGDIEALTKIAENQMTPEFLSSFANYYTGGNGYAASAQTAYEELFGKSDAIASPNNILAIEYIKAILKSKSAILPKTIAREDNFSSSEISGKYPSATALRELIFGGKMKRIRKYVSRPVYDALAEAQKNGRMPVNMDRFGLAVLSAMRLADPFDVARCEGSGGGLENRIISSAGSAGSYEEFISLMATKKYTDARLRRAILFATLGITPSDMSMDIPYVNLLGANEKGRTLLARQRQNEKMGIVTKISDKKAYIGTLDKDRRADAKRIFDIEMKADALYTLCFDETKEASFFEKMSPVFGEKT